MPFKVSHSFFQEIQPLFSLTDTKENYPILDCLYFDLGLCLMMDSPWFLNCVDWRLLVEDRSPINAKLRGEDYCCLREG